MPSGSGIEVVDCGDEDAIGAVINFVEKAVGSKTGGGKSFDTGPPVMVMFAGAFVGLRCDGLISSKISSSSSLSGSGWISTSFSFFGTTKLEKGIRVWSVFTLYMAIFSRSFRSSARWACQL